MKLTTYLSTPSGRKAELALLADLQRTVYPYKWLPNSCRSGADQWKFADQRPTFYHWATQPTIKNEWCQSVQTSNKKWPERLRCPRNSVGFGVEWSKIKVTESISAFFITNDYYACVNAHLTDNSNTAWVGTLHECLLVYTVVLQIVGLK